MGGTEHHKAIYYFSLLRMDASGISGILYTACIVLTILIILRCICGCASTDNTWDDEGPYYKGYRHNNPKYVVRRNGVVIPIEEAKDYPPAVKKNVERLHRELLINNKSN